MYILLLFRLFYAHSEIYDKDLSFQSNFFFRLYATVTKIPLILWRQIYLNLSMIKDVEETPDSIPRDLLSYWSHAEPMSATAQNCNILEISAAHISTFQYITTPNLFVNEDISA